MKTIELNWIYIPSFIYSALYSLHKEKYMPFFGPGLYQYIYWTGNAGYQTYYIGKSEGEIGSRLDDHYKEFKSGGWWMPNDFNSYSKDIYSYIKTAEKGDVNAYFIEPGNKGKPDPEVISGGNKLIEESYILIAPMNSNDREIIGVAEAMLHNALLKKNELYGLNKHRSGWFGETHSVIPDEEIKIINNFPHVKIKEMASSVWDVIVCKGSDVFEG